MSCLYTLCHSKMPLCGLCMCRVSLWVPGAVAPRQDRKKVGTKESAQSSDPPAPPAAGWERWGLCSLLSWGIFPMWAMPATHVTQFNHSLSVTPTLECQHTGAPKCHASP